MTRKTSSFFLLATLALLILRITVHAQGELTPQGAAQKFGTLMRYVINCTSTVVETLTEKAIVNMLEHVTPFGLSADELKEADEL